METVYSLTHNESSWEVDITEHMFYHREHAFCEVCGKKMRFRIEPREKPYSGWTKNLVFEVKEFCPEECESFTIMEVYRYKDGRLFTSNFENLEEKIEYIQNGSKKWNKVSSK
jgi:hypothetical protein